MTSSGGKGWKFAGLWLGLLMILTACSLPLSSKHERATSAVQENYAGSDSSSDSDSESASANQSLNGRWAFLPLNQAEKPPINAAWQSISVPGNWYPQGYDHYGYAWYRLQFTPSPVTKQQTAHLHFSGVDYFTDVWLNGKHLGQHEGYFQAFNFNVSDTLKYGETNELLVRVNSPHEKPEDFSLRKRLIKGIFAHHDTRPGGAWSERGQERNTGGIWNDVYLRYAEQTALQLQQAYTYPVGDLTRWQIRAELNTQGQALTYKARLKWSLQLMNHPDADKTPALSGEQPVRPSFRTNIDKPLLWYPHGYGQQPLYRLTLSLTDGEKVLSEVQQTVAFRQVKATDDDVWYINGKRLLIKGTNYIAHQWLSEMSRADFRQDIQLMLDAHANTVRVHAHVTAQDFYELSDEMGLMVWQDFPLQWGYQDSAEFQAEASAQVRDMVRQFGHHPSIVQWTLHNEPPWDASWMKWKYKDYDKEQNKALDDALYAVALSEEKHRPVAKVSSTAEHPWWGWYSGSWLDYTKPAKHSMITEFGAQALPDKATLGKILGKSPSLPTTNDEWELWRYYNFQRKQTLEIAKVQTGKNIDEFIKNTQDYQARLIQLAAESYRRQAYQPVGAMFHFMLVENWPSMNWAVVDFWRKPKSGYYALQQAYQAVLPSLEWKKAAYAPDEVVKVGLWALNDSWKNHTAVDYRVTVFKDGKRVKTAVWQVDVAADSRHKFADFTVPTFGKGNYQLKAEMVDKRGQQISSNDYVFTVIAKSKMTQK